MAIEQRGKMTDEQAELIAIRLNKVINVPAIPEWLEKIALKAGVIAIDYFLLRNLGDEVYDLLNTVNHGVEDQVELDALIERLAVLADEKINVPLLDGKREARFIYVAVQMIVSALYKGRSLATSPDTGPEPSLPEDAEGNDGQ
jgi:hypothetical protein